jgi:hypothetical protein
MCKVNVGCFSGTSGKYLFGKGMRRRVSSGVFMPVVR